MSFEVESNPKTPNKNVCFSDVVPRTSANFQPSVWGDFFLTYNFNTLEEGDSLKKQASKLKEQVRNMLAISGDSSKKLRLIDSIQRLGLSHHFEEEINEIVECIFQNGCNIVDRDDDDLYTVALKFRLLRQQSYFVSSEIFNKFTNETREFKKSIVEDENGLLSLYEASHLRINGENILDEALAFTTTHLGKIAMDSSSCFGEEVKYALKWPIFKAFPRLMSKNYITLYNNHPSQDNVLLTLAKLDYNNLQNLYQREVAELSRWLKDSKLMEQLSFARDRIVEGYVWALGIYYEPKYSKARILMAKLFTFITFVDDMYDAYATLDELESFTIAIERWDINDIEKLPNYMKVLYEAIFNVYKEIEQDICKDNNIPFALDYAKEEMKRLCKVYLVEAKWFHEGHVPTMEEYMKVATVSSTYHFFGSHLFLGMGEVASKEVFEWAKNDPMLIKAVGVIGRLMNDMNSHKFEQERGHVASAIECYMKQYGVFEEEAVAELEKQVIKSWKDVTQEYMKSTKIISNVFLVRFLNLARTTDLFYKEEDGYTIVDGATKHFITSILIDPIAF